MGVAASSVPPVPSILSVVDLGDVATTNIQQFVARDLGWSGSVGFTVLNTYGDCTHGGNTSYPQGRGDIATNSGYPVGFTANSVSVGTGNPAVVKAPFYQTNKDGSGNDIQTPSQFCRYFSDEDPSTHGMGITAVQNVNNTYGVVYYLNIIRSPQYYIGAGIASVNNGYTGYPVCTRLTHHDWDGQTEPTYGSRASYSGPDPDTGAAFIYALGDGNNTNNYVWLTRVAQAKAFDVNSYQYWNGNAWQNNRLINPTAQQAIKTVFANGTTAPMTDSSQGSINWSPYYKAWIMFDVRIYGLAISDLRVRTSTRPEGPWGPLTVVATTGNKIPSKAADQKGTLELANFLYAFSQQPWYDNTGKSTYATFTYGTSVQRLLNITFA